ncbi:MAG: hypothetical protein L3J50_04485 [Emcibacter sp.]|nr:hypothetical protein [Emcibacter sp.]
MKTIQLLAKEIANLSDYLINNRLMAFNCAAEKGVLFATAKRSSPITDFMTHWDYKNFLVVENQIIHLNDIVNEPYYYSDINFIDHERLLLVCARSGYKSPGNLFKNGRVYSLSGKFLKDYYLGDGIESVQVTKDGRIWTSYFDEGIYGDLPDSKSGLVQWNNDGEKLFEFLPCDGLGSIDECYALNVETENTTWCYYYDGFPLVKIENNTIDTYWTIPVEGSKAFAIHGDNALFLGGYNDHDSIYLLKLTANHTAKIIKKIVPENIAKIDRVCARGDTVYFLSDKILYTLTVQDCMNA